MKKPHEGEKKGSLGCFFCFFTTPSYGFSFSSWFFLCSPGGDNVTDDFWKMKENVSLISYLFFPRSLNSLPFLPLDLILFHDFFSILQSSSPSIFPALPLPQILTHSLSLSLLCPLAVPLSPSFKTLLFSSSCSLSLSLSPVTALSFILSLSHAIFSFSLPLSLSLSMLLSLSLFLSLFCSFLQSHFVSLNLPFSSFFIETSIPFSLFSALSRSLPLPLSLPIPIIGTKTLARLRT